MAHYLTQELSEELSPMNGQGLPAHLKVTWPWPSNMEKRHQILCSIQFLANGGYQRQIGQDHTLCHAQTTVSKYLGQFTAALYDKLFSEWVHFPGTEEARQRISNMFLEKHGVANVLGCVDCTHVKIFPPPGPQGAQYKNRRKDAHTINVQLIADAECRIVSVNARYPGRVHDSFIWQHCNIRTEMKRLHDAGIGRYFILGDSGYPLEPWLMTPVLHAEPDSAQQRYTDWHCRVRNGIERTNGYLKGSLRSLGLDRSLHYSPQKASRIIYAACIIYNMYKHFGYPLADEGQAEERDVGDNDNMAAPRLLRLAQARRTELINSYFL